MKIGAIAEAELKVGHLSKLSNPLGINSYLIRVYHQSVKRIDITAFQLLNLPQQSIPILDFERDLAKGLIQIRH